MNDSRFSIARDGEPDWKNHGLRIIQRSCRWRAWEAFMLLQDVVILRGGLRVGQARFMLRMRV